VWVHHSAVVGKSSVLLSFIIGIYAVSMLTKFDYSQRVEARIFPNLHYRRTRGDMTETYKTVSGYMTQECDQYTGLPRVTPKLYPTRSEAGVTGCFSEITNIKLETSKLVT